MSDSIELLIDGRAALGEGAIWDSQKKVLYWVDIINGEVHIYDPVEHHDRVIPVEQQAGTVVPCKSGGLMLALHHGFAHLDLETEEMKLISDPEQDIPGNRFNDGKCDPAGRFWAGTISMEDKSDMSALYRMDADYSVHKMLDKISISNGIAWSLDHKTMYYIDSPTRRVDAFYYDMDTGGISKRRPVVSVPEEMGLPDGMTLDAEGMIWVALWEGSAVARWNPANGELLEVINIPASRVTSCAFGGANLDELYVTTARIGLNDEELQAQPQAGGLFRAKPGLRGIPAYEFGG